MTTDNGRAATPRSFGAILVLCALVPASLAGLVAATDSDAQRAPLLVLTVQPRAGMDGRRAELRIDDNGAYTSETRVGRLTAAQLRELRAERARVRWRMAPSGPHCEAIPTYEHRVQSLGQAVAWSSPCAPLPDPTVLRFVERAQAIVRAAPGRRIEPSVPAMDAGATPTARDASAAVVARERATRARARAPGSACSRAPRCRGAAGFPAGARRRFTAITSRPSPRSTRGPVGARRAASPSDARTRCARRAASTADASRCPGRDCRARGAVRPTL